MNDPFEAFENKSDSPMCGVDKITIEIPESKSGILMVTPDSKGDGNVHDGISSILPCSSLDADQSVSEGHDQKCWDDSMDEIVFDKVRKNLSQGKNREENSETRNNIMETQPNCTTLQTQLQAKDEQLKNQCNELDLYRNMVQKYRTSVREKLLQIRALEKDVSDLRNSAVDGDDIEVEKPRNIQGETLEQNPTNAEVENYPSIHEVKNESISQHQIIESLTAENNALRKREVSHLQEGATLQKEIIALKIKVQALEGTCNTTAGELEIKAEINKSFVRRLEDYELNKKEIQGEITNLNQEVFQLQKAVEDERKEKFIFQKLLSTSRQTATLTMSKNSGDEETESEIENRDLLLTSDVQSGKVLVASLRKELAEKRKREEGSLRQIFGKLEKLGSNTDLGHDPLKDTEIIQQLSDSKGSIMDQLSDSQQEVIVFLSSEVEELRSQLEGQCEERNKLFLSITEKSKAVNILQKENEILASKAVEDEETLKSLEIDLSTRLGENACLRDEIEELEVNTKRLKEIEAELGKKDKECQKLDLKVKAFSKLKKAADSSATSQEPSESLTRSHPQMGSSDKSTREISLLKRALKQSYEKKFERQHQECSKIAHEKDMEIARLKGYIESKEISIAQRQDSYLVQTIDFEAEHQQDNEDLSNLLNKCDQKCEKNKDILSPKVCIESSSITHLQEKVDTQAAQIIAFEADHQQDQKGLPNSLKKCDQVHEKDVEIARLKDYIESKERFIIQQQEQLDIQIAQRITLEAKHQQEHESLSNALNECNQELKYMRERFATLKESDAYVAWNVVSKTVRKGVSASLSALHDLTKDRESNEVDPYSRLFFSSKSFG